MPTAIRFLLPALLFILISAPKQLAADSADPSADIFEKLNNLTTLRESLAASLGSRSAPIDEVAFMQTCMPIGKELMRWAQDHGYQARQISHKNRNPLNTIPEKDRDIYALFLENQSLKTQTITHPSEPSATYFYARIPYVTSCGHCHGSKNTRPDFVLQKYPTDAAYDFQEGDLRGLYVIRKSNGSLENGTTK